jgi:hypothetical protein
MPLADFSTLSLDARLLEFGERLGAQRRALFSDPLAVADETLRVPWARTRVNGLPAESVQPLDQPLEGGESFPLTRRRVGVAPSEEG